MLTTHNYTLSWYNIFIKGLPEILFKLSYGILNKPLLPFVSLSRISSQYIIQMYSSNDD